MKLLYKPFILKQHFISLEVEVSIWKDNSRQHEVVLYTKLPYFNPDSTWPIIDVGDQLLVSTKDQAKNPTVVNHSKI